MSAATNVLKLSMKVIEMSSLEASRLPNWEHVLPKKLPTLSSSPSKGTNSLTTSSSTAVKTDTSPPSSDGKV
ncbi:hypothetical protein SLEP1_g11427 [Rubroshorea leprosula]|uniref:Uncharacterized protein n=1 Tax=Rubroshorea leprosula TaxID=152421 RepID=A0AAV5IKP6_9ROSI|nr:hypothetical protein SLEP1_g11427 [Rubroshorea leprosula]